MSHPDYSKERCLPCEGGLVHLLTRDDLEFLAASLPTGWSVRADSNAIERTVPFALKGLSRNDLILAAKIETLI